MVNDCDSLFVRESAFVFVCSGMRAFDCVGL